MTDTTSAPVNQNAPVPGAGGMQATVPPRNLSDEAQHVIDSLEAHLGAVVKAAQGNSPALVAAAAKFGEDALAKLESWGVGLRGELQKLEAASPVAAGIAAEVSAAAGLSASQAPAAQ